MVFLFYLLLSIYGRGYGNYTMAFTVEYLGWSKTNGALLTSLYWGAYVISRIIGVALITRCRPQVLIGVDLLLSISSTIPVLLAVHSHPAVYWACTLLYGLGNARIYATGFPWLAQYFAVTSTIGSVPVIGGLVGDILGPVLVGYLFENVTPMGFIWVSLAGGVMCLGLLVLMQLLAERYRKLNGYPGVLKLTVSEELMKQDGTEIDKEEAIGEEEIKEDLIENNDFKDGLMQGGES